MACDEAGIPKLVRISRLTAFGIPGFLRERVIPGAAPAKFLLLGLYPLIHRLRLSATQAQIKAASARVSASVSKKTPYVVACEEAGSKLSKTKALRVPILTETDLLTLLDQSIGCLIASLKSYYYRQ